MKKKYKKKKKKKKENNSEEDEVCIFQALCMNSSCFFIPFLGLRFGNIGLRGEREL